MTEQWNDVKDLYMKLELDEALREALASLAESEVPTPTPTHIPIFIAATSDTAFSEDQCDA